MKKVETSSGSEAADNLIDRVLAGLRDAEPGSHLTLNILSALEARQASPPRFARWTLRPFRSLIPPRSLTLAGTAAFVVLLVVPMVLHHVFPHSPAASFARTAAPLLARPQDAVPTGIHSDVSKASTGRNARPAAPLARQSPRRMESAAFQPKSPADSLRPGATVHSRPEQDLAREETEAPSRPSPPFPLTREERLIHRFVQRHDAYALAALGPANQFAHEREARTDFHLFFEPYPPVSTDEPAFPQPPPIKVPAPTPPQ